MWADQGWSLFSNPVASDCASRLPSRQKIWKPAATAGSTAIQRDGWSTAARSIAP